MLDDGLAAKIEQHFARKARRSEPGRNDEGEGHAEGETKAEGLKLSGAERLRTKA
jgi:hypothetical protein